MRVLKLLLPAIAFAITAGCSDSGRVIVIDNGAGDENIASDAILDDALPVGLASTGGEDFEGEIGLIFDAREVAKKGYIPRFLSFEAVGQYRTYKDTIELGAYSFMGTYKLPVGDVLQTQDEFEVNRGAASLEELTSGLELKLTLKEADGSTVILKDHVIANAVFLSNPAPISIDENVLEQKRTSVALNENVEYFMQVLDHKNEPISQGVKWKSMRKVFGLSDDLPLHSPDSSNAADFLFKFIPIPGEADTYAIKHVGTDRLLKVKTMNTQRREDLCPNRVVGNFGDYETFMHHEGLGVKTATSLAEVENANDFYKYKFKITKDTDNAVRIDHNNKEIKFMECFGFSLRNKYQYKVGFFGAYFDSGTVYAEPTRFRIVSTNTFWEAQSVGSEMVQTVIPAPRIGIAYDSVEKNCGSEKLTTTTGVERTAVTTVSSEWSESLTFLSAYENSIGWEVSVEIDSAFGPSFSSKVSGSQTWRTENSETTTEVNYTSASESIKYSGEKSVTVLPDIETQVTAAYEIYDDVQARFVQRFQIRGMDVRSGEYLTGEQAASQMEFSSFDGVITAVYDDHIEISLAGTAEINNLIRGKTVVVDRVADCTTEI